MKILSRKVLASLVVFILATVFIIYDKIPGMDWVEIAVVTIMGFIVGDGLGTFLYHVQAVKNRDSDVIPKRRKPTAKDRLENLWDIKFLGTVFIFLVGTALFIYGRLGVTEWKYVAMGMIVGYDLLNPIDKVYQ